MKKLAKKKTSKSLSRKKVSKFTKKTKNPSKKIIKISKSKQLENLLDSKVLIDDPYYNELLEGYLERSENKNFILVKDKNKSFGVYPFSIKDVERVESNIIVIKEG